MTIGLNGELGIAHVAVDVETFHLMKHRRMGHVVIAAENRARTENTDWRFAREHRADLHRRRVGAQERAAFEGWRKIKSEEVNVKNSAEAFHIRVPSRPRLQNFYDV